MFGILRLIKSVCFAAPPGLVCLVVGYALHVRLHVAVFELGTCVYNTPLFVVYLCRWSGEIGRSRRDFDCLALRG